MTVQNAWDVNVPGFVTLRGVKEHFKVDKSCRKGRMFSDFTEYLKDNPDVSPVQIDTVEGIKGGPVLLTRPLSRHVVHAGLSPRGQYRTLRVRCL